MDCRICLPASAKPGHAGRVGIRPAVTVARWLDAWPVFILRAAGDKEEACDHPPTPDRDALRIGAGTPHPLEARRRK